MKKPGLSKLEENKLKKRLARQDYKKLFVILTEGKKTEPNYFAGFKKAIESSGSHDVIVEIIGVGEATVRLLPFADDFIEQFGLENAEIWLVTDKDDFPDAQFNELVRQCKKRNDKKHLNNYWHCAWSNECFELWFILHFSFYQAAVSRSEYFRLLNDQFRKLGLGKYEKNSDKIFDWLIQYGNPKLAIAYARKLYEEKKYLLPSKAKPCTTVFELAAQLARYLPPDLRQKFF